MSKKNLPDLDPGYIPAYRFISDYLNEAKTPYAIAWERQDGYLTLYDTFCYGTPEHIQLDLRYLELIIKFSFYAWGGWKLYLCGDKTLSEKIKEICLSAERFEKLVEIAEITYEHPLTVEILEYEQCPSAKESSEPVGRHLDGCRIGFDAGGSDHKISSVIDGEAIYSEEIEWVPKLKSDPDYHYDLILKAMHTAASKMPRVDAIGVSTAGIVVSNRVMMAALFQLVPKELFDKKAKNIYLRAAKEIGDVPVTVRNDGDVSALAGSMSIGENKVLGIAMGTSEAAGYVDANGNLTSWLNELALAPVDLNESAPFDFTAQDIGVGAQYFSQDSVIRLAASAGIELEQDQLPAQKLKVVQELMAQNDLRARKIYENIGCYFAHSLALYSLFYDIKYVLLLGRVVSGIGGDILLAECNRILQEEYPEINDYMTIMMPDEKARRIGQSVAAASLPSIKKSV